MKRSAAAVVQTLQRPNWAWDCPLAEAEPPHFAAANRPDTPRFGDDLPGAGVASLPHLIAD
jgi:hypothetical protein